MPSLHSPVVPAGAFAGAAAWPTAASSPEPSIIIAASVLIISPSERYRCNSTIAVEFYLRGTHEAVSAKEPHTTRDERSAKRRRTPVYRAGLSRDTCRELADQAVSGLCKLRERRHRDGILHIVMSSSTLSSASAIHICPS